MKQKYFLVFLFIFEIFLILLLIFSYTQIDLNLTLSNNNIYQKLQSQLLNLGYFHRNLSTSFFIFILIGLFAVYIVALKIHKKFTQKQLILCLGLVSLLFLSYPAFSHDFFNYMFDARIVTRYGLSPYFFKAQDFSGDSWVRFMQWTHRYYPYGPTWLLSTLVPSLLGLQKFTLTLFLFKLFFLASYLTNCIFIWKLSQLYDKSEAKLALIFYAFNPLIIIETLISPHNEALMVTFVLVALYYFSRKKLVSYISLLISIGIKYVSIILMPLLFFYKKIDTKFYIMLYFLWLITLVPFVLQREPYPWYFTSLVAWASLSRSKWLRMFTIGISAALLSRYISALQGVYDSSVFIYQNTLMIISFTCASLMNLVVW